MAAMKRTKSRDADGKADDAPQNGGKVLGDVNTVASSACTSTGSYDTTEDLTDTDASSQNKSNPSRTRSVRVVMKKNITHEVESHENFSAKERSKYWWSDREKDRMMAKHERLVAKYEQQRAATKPGSTKKPSANKLGSYRGLESWTAAGSLKLDHSIEQCISAVMDEQDRQWQENDDDADVIAQKSVEVTADSARRARLNGLQDAQEALKIRGESWSKRDKSDEISVGSSVSAGTAALNKRKKRSKLLARLDDSNKYLKNSGSDQEDVLGPLKRKDRKKDKKKKKTKKKSKKSSSSRSSASSVQSDDAFDIADLDQTNSRTTNTTQPTTIASHLGEHEKAPLDYDVASSDFASSATTVTAGSAVPVSPLSTTDECPLLSSLRQKQKQLQKESSMAPQDDAKASIYERQSSVEEEDDDEEDVSPLLQILRRQQKEQKLKWQNEQKGSDPGGGGNSGVPTHSGAPVTKLSSMREDMAGDNTPAKFSDPPGRRPRRLASRHGGVHRGKSGDSRSIPEEYVVDDDVESQDGKSKRGSSRRDSSLDVDESKGRSSFLNSPVKGKQALNNLRNGAKTLFKGMKK